MVVDGPDGDGDRVSAASVGEPDDDPVEQWVIDRGPNFEAGYRASRAYHRLHPPDPVWVYNILRTIFGDDFKGRPRKPRDT